MLLLYLPPISITRSFSLPTAEKSRIESRASALGKAVGHARAKPISEVQRRILIGSARRLGLSPAEQVEIGKTSNAMEADFTLMKFEAQLKLKLKQATNRF